LVFFEDKHLTPIQQALEEKRDREGAEALTIDELADLIREVRGETTLQTEARETQEQPEASAEDVIQNERHASEGEPRGMPATAVSEQTAPPPRAVVGPPLDDLYASFTPAVQKLLVRKVFRKDEVEFRKTLDRLTKAATWEDASLVLDDVFQQNGVDPFSREAVWFTDLVYSHFHPESRE
jgi:hypothetical protein